MPELTAHTSNILTGLYSSPPALLLQNITPKILKYFGSLLLLFTCLLNTWSYSAENGEHNEYSTKKKIIFNLRWQGIKMS